jgi:N-acetylglucosamine kinase-like BadF-type ATPase
MNNVPSSVSASGAGQPQEGLPWPFPESVPGRLLGIDVGGSATRAVLVADGQVAGQFTAPPMNALLTGDMTDRLAALIGGVDATAAGVGVPGLRSRDAAAALGAELTRRAGHPVQVATDGETAWLGAFGGSPGIVVFAGTGSGAVGCDGRRWARAGGHGFLLGDEGSAYWIGRAAANAALRWDDKMGGSMALFDAAIEVSGGDLAALVRSVNSHPAERGRLAALAPAVTTLAGTDECARGIALCAAEHLADLATALSRRLGPLPVCGTGGVFRAPVIWDRFAELTGAARPLATPELGAVLLAGRSGVC